MFAATHFANSDPLKDLAIDSLIFHNNNTSFSTGDDVFASQPISKIYADEVIGKEFDGRFRRSDGSILLPSMEMEPEKGFAFREWRRLD